MKYFKNSIAALHIVLFASVAAFGQGTTSQNANAKGQKVIVVTGARISYKLIEKWIDEYAKIDPSLQIVVESRGSNDPAKYDILAEVYEHPQEVKEKRAYVTVGRYAVFPVAKSTSSFAKIYGQEGLTKQHIVQIFFHDIFADQEKLKEIKAPYSVYTRLQRAGVPVIFSQYFGFEQKDIKGTGIAGADTHLLKALLRDSAGVTYFPTCVIFEANGKPVDGITVIPVDANGNGKISDEEKFVDDFNKIVQKLETAEANGVRNIPMDYLHLSVDKENASAEAVNFLKWVNENGHKYLHEFGFLLPDSKHNDKNKFNEFASKSNR
jgi:phosphate transport system substrate-binding protein